MARFSIKTRDAGTLEFFVPDAGGYVRLEGTDKTGTLARQICNGGGFTGSTLTASADSLAQVARKWNRQRRERANA